VFALYRASMRQRTAPAAALTMMSTTAFRWCTPKIAAIAAASSPDVCGRKANAGVVSEFSSLEIMCPSVRPIERAMREPRMDPQSTVFPAQPCCP